MSGIVTVVKDGENGYVDANVERLVRRMRRLLADPEEARALGEAGRRTVRERFGLGRLGADREDAFGEAPKLREVVPCASR